MRARPRFLGKFGAFSDAAAQRCTSSWRSSSPGFCLAGLSRGRGSLFCVGIFKPVRHTSGSRRGGCYPPEVLTSCSISPDYFSWGVVCWLGVLHRRRLPGEGGELASGGMALRCGWLSLGAQLALSSLGRWFAVLRGGHRVGSEVTACHAGLVLGGVLSVLNELDVCWPAPTPHGEA